MIGSSCRVLCSAPLFVPSSASNKTERNGEIVEEASDPTGNSLTKARRDQCSGSALSSASTCCSHQQTPIGLIEWPIGFRQIVVMSVRFAKFGIGLFSVQPSEFGHWCNPSVWLLCPTAFVSKMQASQKSTETNQERERERETRNTVATNDTLAIHKYAGIIRHLLLSCCDRRDCCFCCLCKAASSDGLLLLLPSLLLLLLLYRLGGARYIGPEGRLVSSSLVALCWW